jgi:multidrug efflux pump subunit AcrB
MTSSVSALAPLLVPALLGDLADVTLTAADPTAYVFTHTREHGARPAITLSVAKRKGTNAVALTRRSTSKSAAPEASSFHPTST